MKGLIALHARIEALLGIRAFRLIRFLIAGGIAASSNLAIFFALTEFGDIYYLYASVTAYVLSVAVSFTLQKFWTFQDMPVHDVHTQFVRYGIVISVNLVLNTLLVYILVDSLGVWHVLAQGIATVVIAVAGYFGYQKFVFRDRISTP